jgi:cyclophilin family peptidyl-prolyl cis-trans isomerase
MSYYGGKKAYGSSTTTRKKKPLALTFSLSTCLLGFCIFVSIYGFCIGIHRKRNHDFAVVDKSASEATTSFLKSRASVKNSENSILIGPTIHSLNDLTQDELHPKASHNRHIVSPPPDVKPISLVTCESTAGYLHIIVHPSWAPLGAERFLQMVESKYFASKVALMRCIKGFLCQFGIAGKAEFNNQYNKNLQDDKNWLPEGPSHRTNELGVKRFGKGYLAYAGSGKNSRGNQFIVALKDNERLGGGSPWEVPWGEVVGKESFDTLDKIYTGYGEKGPSQGRLHREGSSESIKKEFPHLDYILGCELVDSR